MINKAKFRRLRMDHRSPGFEAPKSLIYKEFFMANSKQRKILLEEALRLLRWYAMNTELPEVEDDVVKLFKIVEKVGT